MSSHSTRSPLHALGALAVIGVLASALPLSAAPYDQTVIDDGIHVWRNVKDSKGRACSYCHGAPDGFDLAYFNFSEADLRRRDANHIGGADTDKIVALILELRKKYDITNPPDPRTTRVFQPGGTILPGSTAVARDASLAAHLQTKMPTLATGNINSLALADQAVNEVLAYDLWNEPLGVIFPLWSRDPLFGDDHSRVTDWIADIAVHPNNPTAETAIQSLQNTYLANPTEANFWAMYHGTLINSTISTDLTNGNLKAHERSKFFASMIGAHELRMIQTGGTRIRDKGGRHTQWYTVNSYTKPKVQPIFEIGDIGDISGHEFPSYVPLVDLRTASWHTNSHKHIQAGKNAWWWVGFLFNPSLETGPARQEYFPNSHVDTLPDRTRDQGGGTQAMHSKLIRVKSDVVLYRQPDPITGAPSFYRNAARANPVSPFGANPTVDAVRPIYPDTETHHWANTTHKDRFKKFSINETKMRLYMMKKDMDARLAAGGAYWNITGINEWNGYQDFRNALRQLNKYDAANATHNTALYNSVRTAARTLKAQGTTPLTGNGTGLTAQIYNNIDFTGLLATRVDPTIDFDPGAPIDGGTDGAIYAGAGTDVSVRWTGKVQPRFSGTYTFQCLTAGDPATFGPHPADGGVRIYFNNVLIYDRWDSNPGFDPNNGTSAKSLPVTVTAGTKYDFKVEYKQPGAYQMLSIWWASDKELTDVIPQTQLYPN